MAKRRFFEFDKGFLMRLTSDPESLVSLHHSDHHFGLHPWHLNNFTKSVRDTINEEIFRYSPKLDGIILGYKNLALHKLAKIHGDSHFIHCDAQADFFVFKPEINKCLIGTVIKKSKDHVSCRVYNCFPVSIPRPKDEENWIGNNVEVGDVVKIKIECINYQAPSIKGTILQKEGSSDEADGKIITDITDCDESAVVKKRNKKNKKVTAIENYVECNKSKSSMSNIDCNSSFEKDVKRKKKHKEKSLIPNRSVGASDQATSNEEYTYSQTTESEMENHKVTAIENYIECNKSENSMFNIDCNSSFEKDVKRKKKRKEKSLILNRSVGASDQATSNEEYIYSQTTESEMENHKVTAIENYIECNKSENSMFNIDCNSSFEKDVKRKKKHKEKSLIQNRSVGASNQATSNEEYIYSQTTKSEMENHKVTAIENYIESNKSENSIFNIDCKGSFEKDVKRKKKRKEKSLVQNRSVDVSSQATSNEEHIYSDTTTSETENKKVTAYESYIECNKSESNWPNNDCNSSFENVVKHKKKHKAQSLIQNRSVDVSSKATSNEEHTYSETTRSEMENKKVTAIENYIECNKSESKWSNIDCNRSLEKDAKRKKKHKKKLLLQNRSISSEATSNEEYIYSETTESEMNFPISITKRNKEDLHANRGSKMATNHDSTNAESQSKIQMSPVQYDSFLNASVEKHINASLKRKKQISLRMQENYKDDHSMEDVVVKVEKNLASQARKRKLKDTSLNETNSESFQTTTPKKRRKHSSKSLDAIKDDLVSSILKEKMHATDQDYSNIQLKQEEIILPDLDMKSILQSIGSKKDESYNSGTFYNNPNFELSDSSLEKLLHSPVKCELGTSRKKAKAFKKEVCDTDVEYNAKLTIKQEKN